MADIYLRGDKIKSVFELLGDKENDITYSIGWVLADSQSFLRAFLQKVGLKIIDVSSLDLWLQEFDHENGITDIEIKGQNCHIIIEAKRGWSIPQKKQLDLYAKRITGNKYRHNLIICMSECSNEYAQLHLRKKIQGIPIQHLSWKDIAYLTKSVESASHSEKRLLNQLRMYLRRIVNMQQQQSNMVYVVSLGSDVPKGCSISWIDIVEKKNRYFHPVGKGWPSNPPNYLGFRYRGKLQRIHHIESWKIVDDLHSEIREIGKGLWENKHYCYTLGPAIFPFKEVKNGKVYPSGRVWGTLDLLMTCDTVSEARDKTKERIDGAI